MKRVFVYGIVLIFLAACREPSPTIVPPTQTIQVPTTTNIPSKTPTLTLIPFISFTDTPQPSKTSSSTATWTNTPEVKAGELAANIISELCQNIGARITGGEQEEIAAQYIISIFNRLGYETYQQPFTAMRRKTDTSYHSANVITKKVGITPHRIIVGAHYDSVAVGCGADDNASGVAVMLEVADKIRNVETPYTILFVAFGAEEDGMKGSKSYVSQMTREEIDNTVLMVNLDSLIAGDISYVYGNLGDEGIARDWALLKAGELGLPLITQPGDNPEFPVGTTCDCSDHAPFLSVGIQYIYFESTNWALGDKDGYQQTSKEYGESGEIWHTQFDTVTYIKYIFPDRIEEHLSIFTTILLDLLTQYSE